ncbi:MAG: hypothetical protein LBG76_05160 [Treponema sp.]|jgi:hypothetical protein|nr:hypothetical protein [Treponema sp.]
MKNRMSFSRARRAACVFGVFCAFWVAAPAGALDLGALLQGDASFTGGGAGNDGFFAGSGSLTPWISVLLGDQGDLFAAARLTVSGDNEAVAVIPELLRAELEFRSPNMGIQVGRMNYRAPLDFVAGGLFDGLRFSRRAGGGTVYLGAWYTGLLFKKSANITMNWGDSNENNRPLNYGKFYDTYFASKRALTALGFEHPALGGLLQAKAAFIGQADLNPLDDLIRPNHLHSQYLIAAVEAPLAWRQSTVEGGAALEMAHSDDEDSSERWLAMAAEARFSFRLTDIFHDQISVLGRFSSAEKGHTFTPITTSGQGNVFQGNLSGLSLVQAEYTARLTKTLAADLSAFVFFQNPETPYVHPYVAVDGYILGYEFDGFIVWSPFSDLSLKMNAGVFIPQDGRPWGKVALTATMAVY